MPQNAATYQTLVFIDGNGICTYVTDARSGVNTQFDLNLYLRTGGAKIVASYPHSNGSLLLVEMPSIHRLDGR
jgi:hypothetical protein